MGHTHRSITTQMPVVVVTDLVLVLSLFRLSHYNVLNLLQKEKRVAAGVNRFFNESTFRPIRPSSGYREK